jgi:hypothetical protein
MNAKANAERIPYVGLNRVHPTPDLSQIPRERWREVLRETHRSVREDAARTAMSIDLAAGAHAIGLMLEINQEETAMRDRASQAAAIADPLPVARLKRSRAGRIRQLNFRLTAAEHADLLRAADILGLRPTQVARMLTMRGVNQVLREAVG